jgi:hypothetical protein
MRFGVFLKGTSLNILLGWKLFRKNFVEKKEIFLKLYDFPVIITVFEIFKIIYNAFVSEFSYLTISSLIEQDPNEE